MKTSNTQFESTSLIDPVSPNMPSDLSRYYKTNYISKQLFFTTCKCLGYKNDSQFKHILLTPVDPYRTNY